MLLAIEIVGILLMLTLMFVSIWGFILMHKIVNQLRYKNYLTEKLVQNVYMISKEYDPKDKKSFKNEKSNLNFADESNTEGESTKTDENTFQEGADI